MANEFTHKSVGTALTQAEFEAADGTGHVLDSQAEGDIIYASSATVLSRLGVGATNNTLQVVGGVPAWVASPTFVNVTLTSFASNWTNAGRTVADAGILTTVDINGGTLGGVTADGAIRINDSVLMTFGSVDGTDADLSFDGTNLVLLMNSGGFKVRGATDGLGYVFIQDSVTGSAAGDGMRIGFNGGVARIYNYENTAMEFYNNGTKVWEFTNAGVLKANGAKSIITSSGDLTLSPAANLVITKPVIYDTDAGLTAGTTQTQAGGLALTAEVNEVSTVANLDDTVVLPTAVAGLTITVINNGANILRIYPAVSDDLGTGVDTLGRIGIGQVVQFTAKDATTWVATSLSGAHIQTFSADGTFYKLLGLLHVYVEISGGGGGAGGGAGKAAGNIRPSGTAGGGGALNFRHFLTADLAATEAVTIGAGGSAGAGGSTASGSNGSSGAASDFGTKMYAYGGGGGKGATTSGSGSGGGGGGIGAVGAIGANGVGAVGGGPDPGGEITWAGQFGGAGGLNDYADVLAATYGGGAGGGQRTTDSGSNEDGGSSFFGGPGGGGGGGIDASNAVRPSGDGGGHALASGGGAAGGAVDGGVGTAGAAATGGQMTGTGGGGGGAHAAGTGGVGGAGGAPSAGGGGGGAGTPVGGAGGVGAAGYAKATSY